MAQSADRFVSPAVGRALGNLEQLLQPWWSAYGRPVTVRFAAAATPRQVAHQLGTIPDGYLVVSATSPLRTVSPEKWTTDLALLQADAPNTYATLIFYTLREEPLDVS